MRLGWYMDCPDGYDELIELDGTAISGAGRYPLVGLFASCALVVIIFWYPFSFTIDPDIVKERIASFFETPFAAYYFGTEYRAITEVFHKVTFFIPLGASVAWYLKTSRSAFIQTIPAWLIIVLLLFPPLFIEFGQILLPEKSAQLTDVFLEWIGCMIGYKGYLFASARLFTHYSQDSAVTRNQVDELPRIKPEHKSRNSQQHRVIHKKERPVDAVDDHSIFPMLGLMSLFWLLLILLSPILSPLMHSGFHEGLFALARWTNPDSAFQVYWAITAVTLLLITSFIAKSRKSKLSIAILICIPLTALLLTLSIFIDSISWLKIIFATVTGLIISLVVSRALSKAQLTNKGLINIAIIMLVFLLPFNLTPSTIESHLLAGDWTEVGERLYFFLKSLILFVPVGLILTLYERSAFYTNLSFIFLIGFIVTCAPLLLLASGGMVLNVLSLPLGIHAGVWLGQAKSINYA